VAGIAVPLWVVSQNRVDKHGHNSIAVAPDAWLLMAAILVFCAIGLVALYKRKRTLVTFSLFLIGFGFTLFIGIIGFAFILLGGWLMLRAWRLNKYGSTNAKVVAKEAAANRKASRESGGRRGSKEQARATKVTSSSGGTRKPPTANKRYTPKAPARKKVPKPTE
jgi:energy-coupling factor transporter transmembrane protein EcfT